MMNAFLIFVAPFLVLIAAIVLSFWIANRDGIFRDENK